MNPRQYIRVFGLGLMVFSRWQNESEFWCYADDDLGIGITVHVSDLLEVLK